MTLKRIQAFCIGAVLSVATADQLQAQCTNGSLENGNLSNWAIWHGDYTTANQAMIPGTITLSGGRPTVEIEPVPGFTTLDWTLPNQLLKVRDGSKSLRIGDLDRSYDNHDANSAMAGYTFTVNASNANFKFWYAAIMENGGHGTIDQPDLTWFMKLGSNTLANSAIPTGSSDPSWAIYNATKYTRFLPTDPTTDPWFTQGVSQPSYWMRQWTCQRYDLTPWMGKQVTIYFRVRDCAQWGHRAYAYIDGLCTAAPVTANCTLPTSACWYSNAPITLDGTASQNEDTYTISIVQLFPAGTPAGTILATLYTQTFYGEATTLDLRQLYRNGGGGLRFSCGETYQVTFTVTNGCGSSASVVKNIFISCPLDDAGPDKTVCCGESVSLFGSVGDDTRYAWEPMPPNATTSGPLILFTPTQTATYALNVQGPDGCKNIDYVTVTVKQDFDVTVSENCPTGTDLISSCDDYYTMTANVVERPCRGGDPGILNPTQYTYKWTYHGNYYYGKTIPTPPYVNGLDSIQLDVTNGCYSHTYIHPISCPRFEGDIPLVAFPSALAPTNAMNPYNQNLTVKHYDPALVNYWDGAPHAYNSYAYRLTVWDRWGGVIYDHLGVDYTGLEQAEIKWNGRYGGTGDIQPIGIYEFKLWLYNCSHPEGQLVTGTFSYHCIVEYWLFGWQCSESTVEIWTNPSGIFQINLLD